MIHIYSKYINGSFWDYSFENERPLEDGEYSSLTKLLKPILINGVLTEGISQAEIDAKTEEDAEQNALNVVSQRISDGEDFFNKVATKVKRAYDDGNITQAQFKNIRTSLKDVLLPLRFGDWDISQEVINGISRPSGEMGVIYDFLKNKIDQYVLDNY